MELATPALASEEIEEFLSRVSFFGKFSSAQRARVASVSRMVRLPVGKQVQVRGCIVLDRIPPRNPFRIWGALIQEQVEIAQANGNVSPILVTLVKP